MMEIFLVGICIGEFLLFEVGGECSCELICLLVGQGMLFVGILFKVDNIVVVNGVDVVKVFYGLVDIGVNVGELLVKGVVIVCDVEVFGEKLIWVDGVIDDQKLLVVLSLVELGIIICWIQQLILLNVVDYLVFVFELLIGIVGVVLGLIVVYVKDVFGVLVIGSIVSVILVKVSGIGNLDGGGVKVVVGGVIIWDVVMLSVVGDYIFKVMVIDLGEVISDIIIIVVVVGG